MRWIVASILLFIVPYTYVNLKFRKDEKPFEPFADMKEQANVKRLLDAGYTRVSVRAERPYPPLPVEQLVVTGGLGAVITPEAGGLPKPLDTTLVEPPRLPLGYADLVAPAEIPPDTSARLQFTTHLDNNREQLGGAEVYIRDDAVVIVPTFEPVPGDLKARVRDGSVLLTLPAGLLAPGQHVFTLVGARDSLRWSVLVR